jgi:hypothetical protein
VCLLLLGVGARTAVADGMRDRLLAPDPVEVHRAVTDVAGSKDAALADALLEAGLKASHPHLAWPAATPWRPSAPPARRAPSSGTSCRRP